MMIILKSFAVTLWISILVIYRVHRGIYTRPYCDSLLRWWSERLLRYVRLSCRTFNLDEGCFRGNKPVIVMSNHSSAYDIPVMFATLPGSIRMLTKKDLFSIPIWGRGLQVGEFISIDRHNRRQAVKDLAEARKKMETGITLWVAPEGTRSRTGKLLPFKKGGFMLALRSGATIIPVGIRGANEVLPARSASFSLDRQVEVHVGTPIDAASYKAAGIESLMSDVESQLRSLMGTIRG
jgi:1-acyl-sn-glycerol-3-phosphate acyltransferase